MTDPAHPQPSDPFPPEASASGLEFSATAASSLPEASATTPVVQPPASHDLPAGSVLRYDAGTPGGEGPLAGEWADDPTPGKPVPLLSAEEALVEAQVSAMVAGEMVIESVATGKDPRRDGLVVFTGRLLRPSAELFPRWLRELNERGYTPLLRPDGETNALAHAAAQGERVQLRIMKGVAKRDPTRPVVNIVLFVLTVLSTLFVGMTIDGTVALNSVWDLINPANLITGLPFTAALLSILLAHEFGHYFAARYHKVAVTLPYFIPMPFGFGTLGAFIQLREPIADRRKLFDIGVAGPLAGLALAVPLLFLGLSTAEVEAAPMVEGSMFLGNSLLTHAAQWLTFGRILPDAMTGEDVILNQVTFAAWIGLLVTALNLLPVGQLDGGHTVFALFGERARPINIATLLLMSIFAAASLEPVQAVLPWLANVAYSGWFVWILLILLVIGPFHPPALDDVTTLDPRRRLIGFVVIVIFLLTFVPVPIRMF
jgi:membrane-associated protease RseP (regulator of RpoE activity)